MRVERGVPVKIGQRMIGIYYPRAKSFVKKVSRSKHFMRALEAWAIDSPVLKALKEKGCKTIKIFDTENKIVYSCPTDLMLKNGTERDFGNGAQYFLHVRQFKCVVVQGLG